MSVATPGIRDMVAKEVIVPDCSSMKYAGAVRAAYRTPATLLTQSNLKHLCPWRRNAAACKAKRISCATIMAITNSRARK